MGNKSKYPVHRFLSFTPLTDCPLGENPVDDCKACPYSADYHYEGGECVPRDEELAEYVDYRKYRDDDEGWE